jgi:hypothetical protein
MKESYEFSDPKERILNDRICRYGSQGAHAANIKVRPSFKKVIPKLIYQ